MKEKISKLINVKSLVTLILTAVFSVQTVRGYISPYDIIDLFENLDKRNKR